MIGCKNIKRVDVTTGKNKDVTSGSVGYIEMIVRFARYSSDAIEAVEDPMTLPTSNHTDAYKTDLRGMNLV